MLAETNQQVIRIRFIVYNLISTAMATEKAMAATEEAKIDLFEDDDEFEEFEIDQDWQDKKEDKDITQQWEDDWDDDDVTDDFSLQLKRELESNSEKNEAKST